MKNLFTLVLLNCVAIISLAQAPQKFSYQSVIRNAGNQLVSNQSVGIKISILQGSSNGSAVYAEIHNPLTNANGLATIEIGGGTVLSGNFANINWANGPYFVKTETDVNGGSNYTIITTQQLLSVPYAIYANNTSTSVSASGDTLFIGNQAYIVPGISAANNGSGGQTGITAHSCGADSVHNPAKTYGTMTDQQGNVYKTIVIGTQEWMAENLKTSIYRNGDAITNVTDNTQWGGLTTGAWRYFNNDSQYECPFGKLYNWYAVNDMRNLCPTGWHMPSIIEWSSLLSYLGGEGVSAGGKLGSSNNQIWLYPEVGTSNESGFSGLPGGNYNNTFTWGIGDSGAWWSTSGHSTEDAYLLWLGDGPLNANIWNLSKRNGLSVRCLKD
jgi:uncharacterized protein (TIGR02145 family)